MEKHRPKETTNHTQWSAPSNRETFEPRESKSCQTKKTKRMDNKKYGATQEAPKDQRQLAKPMHRPFWKTKTTREPTWDEATLEKKATDTVEMTVDKCGPDGFVHVFGGAWHKDLNKAAEAECFGRGRNRHAVFIDDTGRKFVRYRDVSTHVELFTPYTGTNCENADRLEKRVQTKLIDMGWPQHRRMFVCKGAGSCKGKRAAKIPFPYYTGVLVCEQSMEQIGIRLATKKDHAPRKRKRSSSSL